MASSHCITIASNSNRSIRAPVVLPSTTPVNVHATLLNISKFKLRLKRPSKIFALSGSEVDAEASIEHVLRSAGTDRLLLISCGEPFVGAAEVAEAAQPVLPERDILVIAENSAIEDSAIKQLRACTRLPGIVRAVGLPDLHPGTKYPIGCAFVSDGYIHPPLIGGDIGCGMSWYRTLLSASALSTPSQLRRVADNLCGLEGEWGDQDMRLAWLGGPEKSAGLENDKSLGTIGAGNHFAELQVVQSIEDGFGVRSEEVVLLVHSGSRGFGQEVLRRFSGSETATGGGKTSLPADSDEAAEYLDLHNVACAWAEANRDLIAYRFLSRLETTAWTSPDRAKVWQRRFANIHHNNVVPTLWPPSDSVQDPTNATDVQQRIMYIHRKGAAPCFLSTPLFPLPGSRGAPTLFLAPTLSSYTNYGEKNCLSAAHGAGRAMSRTKASATLRKMYGGKGDAISGMKTKKKREKGSKSDRRQLEEGLDQLYQGTNKERGGPVDGQYKDDAGWVICDEKELLWEEAPEAYKDVESVGKDLEETGVARIVGWTRPRVTYKLRKE